MTTTEGKGGLMLSRREGQKILIGDDIVLKVSSIDGNYVRLHIVAPRDIRIMREEIVDRSQDADNAT